MVCKACLAGEPSGRLVTGPLLTYAVKFEQDSKTIVTINGVGKIRVLIKNFESIYGVEFESESSAIVQSLSRRRRAVPAQSSLCEP